MEIEQIIRRIVREELERALGSTEALSAPEPLTMDELMSAGEVAAMLGVKIGSLANWRSEGRGPRFLKKGRVIRYRRADVRTWLESQS